MTKQGPIAYQMLPRSLRLSGGRLTKPKLPGEAEDKNADFA
jgi:hypothetical protein